MALLAVNPRVSGGIVRLILLCIAIATAVPAVAESQRQEDRIIIAHRGASGYLPEHTLAAKALAHGMGADFIEQDVILSKDGVPVVLHDLELDDISDVATVFPDRARSDGHYYVIDFTLEELRQLTLTERKRRGNRARYPGRFPLDSSVFRIATLAEEIELIQGMNQSTGRVAGLYTELKSPAWHREQGQDMTPVVLDVLAHYGYTRRSDPIYLQCFDPAELQRVRMDLGSDLKLVQLIGENRWNEADTDYRQMRSAAGLKQVAGYADGIGPAIGHVLKSRLGRVHVTALVQEAHELGMVVHPYTLRRDKLPRYVSTFDELLELLFERASVDGIFTDFPDLGVRYLHQSAAPAAL